MLETLLKDLSRGQVRFVLVGGVAMRLHGSDQPTEGLDLCYGPERDNLVALLQALRPHRPRLGDGAPVGLEALESAPSLSLQTDLGRLELLGEVSGVRSFRDLSRHAVHLRLGEEYVPVASLEDLIRMKTAAGRPKDRAHLPELEALCTLLEEDVQEPS